MICLFKLLFEVLLALREEEKEEKIVIKAPKMEKNVKVTSVTKRFSIAQREVFSPKRKKRIHKFIMKSWNVETEDKRICLMITHEK